MSHMPGVLCALFKVCQEVHRGKCVSSSLLNLEPLVSHHITNLPPPAVCADQLQSTVFPAATQSTSGTVLCQQPSHFKLYRAFCPTGPSLSQLRACWERMSANALSALGYSIRLCLQKSYFLLMLNALSHFLNVHLNCISVALTMNAKWGGSIRIMYRMNTY